jgi:hypothetical protein
MYTRFDLIRYALIVRSKCYTYAHMEESNEALYHDSNNLHGMCAIASAAYVEYLEKIGINAYCVYTNRHCWVSVGTYFVDLTSSQYRIADLLVLKKKPFMDLVKRSTWNAYCYTGYKRVDKKDYKDAFCTWYAGQSPTSKVINRILTIGELNV